MNSSAKLSAEIVMTVPKTVGTVPLPKVEKRIVASWPSATLSISIAETLAMWLDYSLLECLT